MGLVEKNVIGYQCENCGKVHEAESVFTDDMPVGFFLQLHRVTGTRRKHYDTGQLFFCDKECLVNYFQFGISSSMHPFRPIGRDRL